MATYFLRFTSTAEADLRRNVSYHSTGIRKEDATKKEVAEMLDCNVSAIKVLKGYYVQELNGLCAFEVEADSIEEAEESVEQYQNRYQYGESWAIFSGVYRGDCPEGCTFLATKILKQSAAAESN